MGVPGRGGGASLTLAITNYGDSDHVGFVHDTAIGDGQAVSELTTFVDRTGSLAITSAHRLLERKRSTPDQAKHSM